MADSGLTTVQRSVHEEGTRQVQRIASYPKITVTVGGRGVCAATFKHGFGYHPLLAWLDNTMEALAGDAASPERERERRRRPHHRDR